MTTKTERLGILPFFGKATVRADQPPRWGDIFANLSSPYWDNMLRFAMSLTASKPDAEDLLQTSLVKALAAFPKFLHDHFDNDLEAARNSSHTRNWLLKIVKNTWLDAAPLRRRWVYDDDGHLFDSEAAPREILDGSLPSEEARFFEEALDDDWQRIFRELTPRQRSVVFLAANDYAYKEIAAILEIPVGTVMSTLSRTLRKLRRDAPGAPPRE